MLNTEGERKYVVKGYNTSVIIYAVVPSGMPLRCLLLLRCMISIVGFLDNFFENIVVLRIARDFFGR